VRWTAGASEMRPYQSDLGELANFVQPENPGQVEVVGLVSARFISGVNARTPVGTNAAKDMAYALQEFLQQQHRERAQSMIRIELCVPA
jgi:hypothetical protein